MIYSLKRIENILHNKDIAFNIAQALQRKTPSILTRKNKEVVEDIIHGDYGLLQYVKNDNMFVLTLCNGEEITNTNYISHMLVFSVEEHGGGLPVLNIDAGCGVIYHEQDFYLEKSEELTPVSFTFRPSISIRIDFDEMEFAQRFEDSHVSEQELYMDNFDNRRKTSIN